MQNPVKNLDISSATARVAQGCEKPKKFYQIQLSQDMHLIKRTLNHTGNLIKGHPFSR